MGVAGISWTSTDGRRAFEEIGTHCNVTTTTSTPGVVTVTRRCFATETYGKPLWFGRYLVYS